MFETTVPVTTANETIGMIEYGGSLPGKALINLVLGYGVVARPAPRVATRDSFRSQPAATKGSVFAQRLDGIGRAARVIAAIVTEKRRDRVAIQPDKCQQGPGKQLSQCAEHYADCNASAANLRIAVSIDDKPLLRVALR